MVVSLWENVSQILGLMALEGVAGHCKTYFEERAKDGEDDDCEDGDDDTGTEM